MAYENLDAWKRSSRLCVDIYKTTAELKDYGFKDQLTRSALSIPSNLAEGLERQSNKEQKQFVTIARGSAAELKTQIYIGIEIGYITSHRPLPASRKSLNLIFCGQREAGSGKRS